jgi:hypothetical protein
MAKRKPPAGLSANVQDIAQYDSIGGIYDFVGGLSIYHRLAWGVSTSAYQEFVDQARLTCNGGHMLDAGCGSMLFSARAHRQPGREVVVDEPVASAGRRRF